MSLSDKLGSEVKDLSLPINAKCFFKSLSYYPQQVPCSVAQLCWEVYLLTSMEKH